MASWQAPEPALDAEWTPAAHVAGSSLSLKLYVWGAPVAQSRPRGRVVTPAGKRPFIQFYEEKKSADWQLEVAKQVREQVPLLQVTGDGSDFVLPATGRVLMSIRFNIAKPVSYPKSVVHNTRKPDVDNLGKAVLDGIVKGRIIEDDNLVTDLVVYKRYANVEHPEGVEIDLTVLPI